MLTQYDCSSIIDKYITSYIKHYHLDLSKESSYKTLCKVIYDSIQRCSRKEIDTFRFSYHDDWIKMFIEYYQFMVMYIKELEQQMLDTILSKLKEVDSEVSNVHLYYLCDDTDYNHLSFLLYRFDYPFFFGGDPYVPVEVFKRNTIDVDRLVYRFHYEIGRASCRERV